MSTADSRIQCSAGNTRWCYSISIDDPHLCSAKSFGRLLARALNVVSCPVVTMNGLQIVPGVPLALQGNSGGGPIHTVEELLDELPSLVQFVEGEFFFFSTSQVAEDANQRVEFRDKMERAEFFLNVSDNMTFGVITRSLELACSLLRDDWPARLEKYEFATAFR
jgi:hypothetical protein